MTTPGRQGRAEESSHTSALPVGAHDPEDPADRQDPADREHPEASTSAPDGLLHTLLATASAPAPDGWRRRTSAGYTVSLRRADQGPDEVLELLTPDGPLCLTIHLAKDGPRVEIHGAELHLHAEKRLRLEGEHVEVLAHSGLELRSGGAIHQSAAGTITSKAFEHDIESTHGEIRLTANDDVAVEGERIRLNSPMAPLPRHLKTPAGSA